MADPTSPPPYPDMPRLRENVPEAVIQRVLKSKTSWDHGTARYFLETAIDRIYDSWLIGATIEEELSKHFAEVPRFTMKDGGRGITLRLTSEEADFFVNEAFDQFTNDVVARIPEFSEVEIMDA